ncbi:MAG: sigma-54 dependent transcriptional regulator [Thermodesulfobacteriota bacterium]|nr:sigma-54 dependent transcriptional regulator [Thermodesulfobacteriota bacterium]
MTQKSETINILVVDDEKSIRRLIEKEISSLRRTVKTAGSRTEAINAIKKLSFDIIILDIRLPDANGIELMEELQAEISLVKVILITGFGDVDDAVEAMKMGAYDYITKPFDLNRLEVVIEKAYQQVSLERENIILRHRHKQEKKIPMHLVGQSSATNHLRFMIDKVAPTGVSVLISGESGTGKNVAAKLIHSQSMRAGIPLITKSCATLQSELMRSELFGHKKGAFTGADKSEEGLLAIADKGTLFLDEIGDLPLNVQPSFLRLLENQTFRRVGEKNEKQVDIRFIFATNRELQKEVEAGRFNEALYHRINVFNIKILPLRKRKEEIPVLAKYFLGQLQPNNDNYKISKKAKQLLLKYNWPGNARELYNVIERGMILSENKIITEQTLPFELLESFNEDRCDNPFSSLEEIEQCHIKKVLEYTDGHRAKAAKILGISRKTLYRRLSVEMIK